MRTSRAANADGAEVAAQIFSQWRRVLLLVLLHIYYHQFIFALCLISFIFNA